MSCLQGTCSQLVKILLLLSVQTCMFKALSREGSMWIWEGSFVGVPREVMMRGRCARRAFSRAASSMSMLWWCVYLSARGAPDAASTDCTSSADRAQCDISASATAAVCMHCPGPTRYKHVVTVQWHMPCLAHHILRCLNKQMTDLVHHPSDCIQSAVSVSV